MIASLSLRTTTFTGTSTACIEWRSDATNRPKIMEIGVIQLDATACTYGLGRPQAIGVTPVNVAFQVEDPGDSASTVNGSLSWGTSPTVPLIYHRLWNTPPTAGVGVLWFFPRGLVIPASGSVVIWNVTTTVACDINCVVQE